MAHVHYQFITQPSATFPLRPRSRFPSFLGSSTPSLHLAIRLTAGERDRGGQTAGARESETERKTEREKKKGRRGEQEKKRGTNRNDHDQRNVAMVSSGLQDRGLYSLAASGAFTSLSLSVPLKPRCMPRMQPATRARKNGVHVLRSPPVDICIKSSLSTGWGGRAH